MSEEHPIPNHFINELISKHIGKTLTVTVKFRYQLKEAIDFFIHYLLTYCEEINKEKSHHHINISTLKEALEETGFSAFLDSLEKSAKQHSPPMAKRSLRDIEVEAEKSPQNEASSSLVTG